MPSGRTEMTIDWLIHALAIAGAAELVLLGWLI
jgi:hypothetical protein